MSEEKAVVPNETVVINNTGSLADTPFPDLTREDVADLDGMKVSDKKGREFILRLKTKAVDGGEKLQNIEADRVSTEDTLHLGDGVEVDAEWDPQNYLEVLYDSYLDAVQHSDLLFIDKIAGQYSGPIYDEHSCFEDFCKDCLTHLKDQGALFKSKQTLGSITNRQYQNAKMILEFCEETLRKFLEGSIKF